MPVPPHPHEPTNGSNIMAWARAVALLGTPTVVTILVVWVGTQELPKLVRNTDLIIQLLNTNRDMMRAGELRDEEMLRIMRWICAGVQKDDTDRRNCFQK